MVRAMVVVVVVFFRLVFSFSRIVGDEKTW